MSPEKELMLQEASEKLIQFQLEQFQKRKSFVDRVHSAFILGTSMICDLEPTEKQLSWLHAVYPGSKVESMSDFPQGGRFTTITPHVFTCEIDYSLTRYLNKSVSS